MAKRGKRRRSDRSRGRKDNRKKAKLTGIIIPYGASDAEIGRITLEQGKANAAKSLLQDESLRRIDDLRRKAGPEPVELP